MKIKATPTREAVLGLLQRNITTETELLNEDESALAKMNAPGALYTGVDPGNLKRSIIMRKQLLESLDDQKTILDAHVAPRILVEMDL